MIENGQNKNKAIITLIMVGISTLLLTSSVVVPTMVNLKYVQPGIVDTLLFIRENSKNDIEIGSYTVYMTATPSLVKSDFGSTADFISYINASLGTDTLEELWDNLTALPVYSGDYNSSLLGLFNDNIQSTYGTQIPGISEAMNNSVSMGYNNTNVFNLFNGTSYEKNNRTYYLPGLVQRNYTQGIGLLQFYIYYERPWLAPGGLGINNITEIYGLPTRIHLDKVAEWIQNVLYVKTTEHISQVLGFTVPEVNLTTAVNHYVKLQWANSIFLSEGMGSRDSLFTGFEVNCIFADMDQILETWNSFENFALITEWFNAIDGNATSEVFLMSLLSLNTTQFDILKNWLVDLEPHMQELLLDYLYISQTDLFYERMFYEQWSSNIIFEEGICGGFEIDMEIQSNHMVNLWDENNPNSLTSYEGITQWFKAVNKRGGRTYIFLADAFYLNEAQMDAIREWLEDWRVNTFYEVAECNNLFENIKQEVQITTSVLAYTGGLVALVSLGVLLFKKARKHRV